MLSQQSSSQKLPYINRQRIYCSNFEIPSTHFYNHFTLKVYCYYFSHFEGVKSMYFLMSYTLLLKNCSYLLHIQYYNHFHNHLHNYCNHRHNYYNLFHILQFDFHHNHRSFTHNSLPLNLHSWFIPHFNSNSNCLNYPSKIKSFLLLL